MQNTAVQMTSNRTTRESASASGSKTSVKGRNNVAVESADPFLQIIMSMISQSQIGVDNQSQGSDGSISGINPLLSLLQNPQSLQNLQNPQNLQNLQNSQPNILSLFKLADTQDSQTGNVLQQLLGTDQQLTANQLLQLTQLVTDNADVSQTDASSFLTQLINLSKAQGTEGLESLLNAGDLKSLSMNKTVSLSALADTTDMLSTEKGYQDAIAKVKELLSSTGKKADDSNSTDIDVDLLQSELIKSKDVTPFELSFKTASNTSETSILDQISTEVKQNVNLGKNEFTLKLKPESLGEITIKIVEEAGKSTVSITTASAQTAKLINNDLEALKQAVAPLNVHVNEAVIHTNEAQQGSMQQYSMAGQQFAGQQFAGQQNFTRFVNSTYGNADSDLNVSVPDQLQSIPVNRTASDRLDAYI